MVELLVDIGADVELSAENDIRVDPTGINKTELDEALLPHPPRSCSPARCLPASAG
jgi:hypothetical protein